MEGGSCVDVKGPEGGGKVPSGEEAGEGEVNEEDLWRYPVEGGATFVGCTKSAGFAPFGIHLFNSALYSYASSSPMFATTVFGFDFHWNTELMIEPKKDLEEDPATGA